MNRMVDGKFPATRLDISPIKELDTATLNNVLSVCEETNRMEVYSTKMEYPDFMKEADKELEKLKDDLYEMDRKQE